ncbi:MAG TPA: Ig-like domain-containing protein [Brevibacterium senegalense]|uniref:Ig-like domain-containing protein n=1 Tax=Brevibacterium senegalense TaxID=1033736 RepID=A0A921SNM0_9MICO|nr:Ig-like domain-containing protein [Brevibacterium senegalense]
MESLYFPEVFVRRRAHTLLATAGIAALVLSGCTPGEPGTPSGPGDDSTGAQSDPAPVVSVVNDPVEDDTATAGGEVDADSQDPSDAPTASGTASDAADDSADSDSTSDGVDADATDTGTVHINAGEELQLAVDGGVFTEVRLIDADHDSVPVDTGELDPGEDTDGSESGETAEATDTTEPADDAEAAAGGSVATTPGLVDAESADGEASDDGGATATSGADETGTRWESSVDLVTGATYTWEATTESPDGAEHTVTGTVTTPETTAQEELTAKTVIADDATVGVGAPIIVMFNSTIPEDARAAIEARLNVEVTDEDGEPVDVEGSWGWLYDTDGISRVHYRPKEFWPSDVDVQVDLPLEGVEYSPRWYGKEDVELEFEVGRDQRVVADAQTHRMTIERDGEEIADWPASLGTPQAPSYNGTHVVMAKHEFYTMTSERWNYETDVSWAVRIHNNGEFIHAAPWSVGSQGQANVSHGCINLSTERAKEYFDMALYGDPVEITGSSVDLTTEHSDISDWVYSWEDWQELSALD